MGHAPGRGRELALAAAPPCRLIATRLEPGDDLVVERRCLVAASAGVTVDVAFSRARRRGGVAGRVVLMRLTGAGVAFLQATESSIEVELELGEELEAPVATVVCFEGTIEYELRLARIGVGLGRRAGVEWMPALKEEALLDQPPALHSGHVEDERDPVDNAPPDTRGGSCSRPADPRGR